MKIAVVEPFGEGGILHVAHMFSNALAARGHNVQLVTATDAEVVPLGRIYTLVEGFGLDRSDVALRGSRSPLARARWMILRIRLAVGFVLQYARAMRAARDAGVDVVVVSTILRYPFIGWLLRRAQGHGIKIVQLCHEFELREERPSLADRFLRLTNRGVHARFDHIIFLSKHQRQRFRQACPEVHDSRLGYIPLGNEQIFQEFAEEGAVERYLESIGAPCDLSAYLLFFGRVRPDKGVDDLLEAYAALADEGRDVPPLVIAGHARPAYREELRTRAEAIPGGRVHLGGDYVPSGAVWELTRRARIAVLPYRSASQSAALQVALTAGVPVVARSVGGIGEMVEHGVSAVVVGDGAPPDLAWALGQLLEDPDLADMVAANGRDLAFGRYSWDAFAAAFEAEVR